MGRTRRTVVLVVTASIAVLATLTGVAAPVDAAARRSGERVEFTVEGTFCEAEITGQRTWRDGTTVVRASQSGVSRSSIALLRGPITVHSTVITRPDGSVRGYGRWSLEPDASTGTISGHFSTRSSGLEIRLIGRGRQALRGFTVKMTTSLNEPSDDPSNSGACGPDGTPLADFAGEGSAMAPAVNPPRGAVVVESEKAFADAVADLTAAIQNNPNLGLVSTVDHAAAAAGRDLVLPPTTELFFGNPRIGTPLMQASQQTGIDLPQKILIWEDLVGTVRVAYNAPRYLQSRHDIDGAEQQLEMVAGALAALSGVATGTTVDPVFDAGKVRNGQGLVTLTSDRSVDETSAAIVAALTAAPPVNVAFELAHDANAARVGLELRPTRLVVFGNPSLGTKLMQTNQTVALDLPQKILVYEDEAGDTIVAYNDPAYVAKRHRINGQSQVLEILAGALANFAGQ